MATRRRKNLNLLDRHKADVTYSVGGLTVTIGGVQASEAASVAQAILNAARELRTHYPELDPELSPVHGGVVDQPEEPEDDIFVLPPEAKRRVGFS